MLNAFSSENFEVPSETGPKIAVFGAKRGVKLNFWFCDPRRHILLRNRVYWRILRRNPCGRVGCRRLKNSSKKRRSSRLNNLMREIVHAQKRKPLSNLNEILQDGWYPRRNHVGKFWWRSSSLGAYSLQHSRTTVRMCDPINE